MWGLFKRPVHGPARFAEGRVGYAVGDIHGRADLLSDMLDLLESRAEEDRRRGGPPIVVFLGDYVDRGRESAQAIDLLISGRPRQFECHFLRGNHEVSLVSFLDDPSANRGWLLQGGAETLMSYGVQPPAFNGSAAEWRNAAATLRGCMPETHLAFLANLERYVTFGDYAFVHAGVDPARPLDKQTDEALYWSRAAFIASKRPFSHRIVHGHTPVEGPYLDDRRIDVDTGAYASGVLTAARFEDDAVSFLSVRRAMPREPIPLTAELVF